MSPKLVTLEKILCDKLEFLSNNVALLFDLDKVEINNLGSEELRNSSQWFIDMSFSSP
ncbi:MAG: hypothetical protein V7K54_10825 [Nostoc sp.]